MEVQTHRSTIQSLVVLGTGTGTWSVLKYNVRVLVLVLVLACQVLVLVRKYLSPRQTFSAVTDTLTSVLCITFNETLSVWTTGFHIQVSVFGTICSS